MQIGGTMVEHAERWVDSLTDLATLRTLRDGISAALTEQERIRQTVVTSSPDYLPTWDELFGADVARAEDALRRVKERMTQIMWN